MTRVSDTAVMDAQSNASPSVLSADKRERSRLVAEDRPGVSRRQGLARSLARLARLSRALADGRPVRHQEALSPLPARAVLDHHQPRRLHSRLELHLCAAGRRRHEQLPALRRLRLHRLAIHLAARASMAAMCSSPTDLSFSNFRAPLSIYIYQIGLAEPDHPRPQFSDLCAVTVVLFGLWPSWQTLLVIPGILLVCINGMSCRHVARNAVRAVPRYPADRARPSCR